jgi:hypothetical protein
MLDFGSYVQKNIELYTVKSHIFKIITIILKIIGIRERILATHANTYNSTIIVNKYFDDLRLKCLI